MQHVFFTVPKPQFNSVSIDDCFVVRAGEQKEHVPFSVYFSGWLFPLSCTTHSNIHKHPNENLEFLTLRFQVSYYLTFSWSCCKLQFNLEHSK